MGESGFGWARSLWRTVDSTLVSISKTAKRIVRVLRLLRAFMVLAVLVVLASAVVGIVWPDWFAYAYAAAVVFLIIPLFILLALVSLPLQAKSLVRLIDLGYPENAKELAIRAAARKMHEQSIESEELLVETAWNESKKMLKRYRERARRLREEEAARAAAAARAAQAAAEAHRAADKARRERDD